MMPRRLPLALALAALVAAQLSCASAGYVPTPAEPAARQALPPEYRIFYDSLKDYGDWTLIEPYGYVFRPSVNFVAWQPYEDGFWAPSDIWGWVWISAEPFGWATYHYGDWMYDEYEGWVWLPGPSWGPGWVTWSQSEGYVGWAPDLGGGLPYDQIPGGGYLYVPTSQLAATDLPSRVRRAGDLGAKVADARPVKNTVEIEGVQIDRGPPIAEVEKQTGPLTRVRIEDLLPAGFAVRDTLGPAGRPGSVAPLDPVEQANRAGERAAREARGWLKRGGAPPARVPVVRPLGVPGGKPGEAPRRLPRLVPGRAAPSDSTGG